MSSKTPTDAVAVATEEGSAPPAPAAPPQPATARPTTGPRARVPLRFSIRVEQEADGRWAVALAPDVVSRFPSRHQAVAAGKAVALRTLAARIERGLMRDSDLLEVVFDVREP